MQFRGRDFDTDTKRTKAALQAVAEKHSSARPKGGEAIDLGRREWGETLFGAAATSLLAITESPRKYYPGVICPVP